MIGGKQPDGSVDKVTSTIARQMFKCTSFEELPRGVGQFSPQAGAQATEATKNYVVGEFHARGICDIDHAGRRGAGSCTQAKETTFDKEWKFSEEQGAQLKRCILRGDTKESEVTQEAWCLDLVQDLGSLGIECRRLKNLKGSRSTAHMKDRFGGQVGKTFAPVRTSPVCAKSRRQDPKPSKTSKLVSEGTEVNINVRRMQMAFERCQKTLSSAPSRMRTCSSAMALLTPSIFERPAADSEDADNAHAVPKLAMSSMCNVSKGLSKGPGSTCSTADDRYLDNSSSCVDSDDDHSAGDCLSPLVVPRTLYNVTEANMGESCNALQ